MESDSGATTYRYKVRGRHALLLQKEPPSKLGILVVGQLTVINNIQPIDLRIIVQREDNL
jgi:hypothetical protein